MYIEASFFLHTNVS